MRLWLELGRDDVEDALEMLREVPSIAARHSRHSDWTPVLRPGTHGGGRAFALVSVEVDGKEGDVIMRIHHCSVAALALSAVLASAGFAVAEEAHLGAELSAASEVPPNDSGGTGTADVNYDTESKELSWTITFSGLTGPLTAAHFHGPAPEGENAGVVVPIEGAESPLEGSATLTDEQATQLMEGMLYVNLHTDAHPDGEIRGQVTD
jgi:hypothetical protein